MPAATSPSAMPFTSSGCSLQKSAICSKASEVFSTSQTAVALGISGPWDMSSRAPAWRDGGRASGRGLRMVDPDVPSHAVEWGWATIGRGREGRNRGVEAPSPILRAPEIRLSFMP